MMNSEVVVAELMLLQIQTVELELLDVHASAVKSHEASVIVKTEFARRNWGVVVDVVIE